MCRFELRKDIAVIRNYGQLLIDVAACTPDGICCFFTSYMFMEYVIGEWDRMGILQQVLQCIVNYFIRQLIYKTVINIVSLRYIAGVGTQVDLLRDKGCGGNNTCTGQLQASL